MPALRKHVPFMHAESESESGGPSNSRIVAAVLANVEDSSRATRAQVTHREFRELIQARGRSCDEVLLELRRAAVMRDAGGPGTLTGAVARRRITSGHTTNGQITSGQLAGGQLDGGRGTGGEVVTIDELEADNVRLRKLVADQQLAIEGLRQSHRSEPPLAG